MFNSFLHVKRQVSESMGRDQLAELATDLFPIPRSISGKDFRKSVEMVARWIPLRKHSIRSGKKVFDWKIPPEWSLRRARLWTEDGSRLILDSDENSLHVLNFSEPCDRVVDFDELDMHLFSLPSQPNAIPYVTSYYEPRWGFCLTEEQRATLEPGKYRVEIDVDKTSGELNFYSFFLPASRPTMQTVLLSSYMCHPSMGNNELSGPLAMVWIFQALRRRKRRVNYLFYVGPETIGALAFLRQNSLFGQVPISAGIVLTCLGGDAPKVSLKLSRRDAAGRPSSADKLSRHLAQVDAESFEIRGFDPAEGSDERQYCSPGFNLPVIQAARTVYGRYPEYHTSLDDLDFMNIDDVIDSAEKLASFLDVLEVANLRPRVSVRKGEPFLSSRGLYSTINVGGIREDPATNLDLLRRLISLADGRLTVLEICSKLGEHPFSVRQALRTLSRVGLLRKVFG